MSDDNPLRRAADRARNAGIIRYGHEPAYIEREVAALLEAVDALWDVPFGPQHDAARLTATAGVFVMAGKLSDKILGSQRGTV